ncbi:hypothetical protein WICMUC_002954 [Wickerhamomyces mucosus]|uniref:Uncharacterized protein n=1 Tax=Wickerhamomyces mucosus TaxID=1378264 RepID=A0A9P8PP33_9ASCO|nr:hypothetical protein WICMUC_002954 [Wickerhamomyces mucosus]
MGLNLLVEGINQQSDQFLQLFQFSAMTMKYLLVGLEALTAPVGWDDKFVVPVGPVLTGSKGFGDGTAPILAEEEVETGCNGFRLIKSCIEPVNCDCNGLSASSLLTAGLTVQASSSVPAVGIAGVVDFIGEGRLSPTLFIDPARLTFNAPLESVIKPPFPVGLVDKGSRLNFLSKYLVTLIISPSLNPKVLKTDASIDSMMLGSICSLWKFVVYLWH